MPGLNSPISFSLHLPSRYHYTDYQQMKKPGFGAPAWSPAAESDPEAHVRTAGLHEAAGHLRCSPQERTVCNSNQEGPQRENQLAKRGQREKNDQSKPISQEEKKGALSLCACSWFPGQVSEVLTPVADLPGCSASCCHYSNKKLREPDHCLSPSKWEELNLEVPLFEP